MLSVPLLFNNCTASLRSCKNPVSLAINAATTTAEDPVAFESFDAAMTALGTFKIASAAIKASGTNLSTASDLTLLLPLDQVRAALHTPVALFITASPRFNGQCSNG